jgi:plastocyanin
MRRLIFAAMTAAAALSTIAVVRAAQHVVSQKGKTFSSETMTVKPGDEVVFRNDDDVTHNVFSNTSGMSFNLTQSPGSNSSQVFNSEGTAEIRCAFHTKMKMTIVVKK